MIVYFLINDFEKGFVQMVFTQADPENVNINIKSGNTEFNFNINSYMDAGLKSDKYLDENYSKRFNEILKEYGPEPGSQPKKDSNDKYEGSFVFGLPLVCQVVNDIMKEESEELKKHEFTSEIKNIEKFEMVSLAEGKAINPMNWVYISDKRPQKLGNIYDDYEIPSQDESTKDFSLIEKEIKKLYEDFKTNRYILFYGLPDIHRKIVIYITTYESMDDVKFNLLFRTPFFTNEFIIGANGYDDLKGTLKDIIKKILIHYRKMIIHIETKQGNKFNLENLKTMLKEQFKTIEGICIEKKDDEIDLKIKRFSKIELSGVNEIPVCNDDDEKNLFDLVQIKKIDLEKKPAYRLIYNVSQQIEIKKQTNSIWYQFFEVYDFDYKPILEDKFKEILALIKGEQPEIEDVDKGKLEKVFIDRGDL